MAAQPRSYLFVPGDRPDRFGKALASGADRIILDLEDAVAPGAKDAARESVGQWLRHHADAPVLVRINPADTPWYAADLQLLDANPHAGLLLPKAEPVTAATLVPAVSVNGRRECVMLVESVAGVLGLRELAAVRAVSRLAFGSIDFAVDANMADGDDEPGMTVVRVQLALESRSAGLPPPIDGVTPGFGADDPARQQAVRVKRLGFGAKLCIHPRQVPGVHAAFDPTPEERDWAARVLAAFEAAGGAAIAVDGKMVDKPVVLRARRILDVA